MTIATSIRATAAAAIIGLAGMAIAAPPAAAHDFRKGPSHHHHYQPHWSGHGGHFYGRPYGYYSRILPVPVILRTLADDYGYYRVYTIRYREPIYWRGYGPLYRFGAYVAEVPGRRGGRVLIHLDPHSGRVIGKVYNGHWR